MMVMLKILKVQSRRKQLFDMLISYESPILEFLIIKTNVCRCRFDNSLFRANSVANKMMTNYSRLIVNEYMIHILQKPTQEIIELLSNYEGNPFEIYPNPDDRESFNKENLERIQIYAKKFLDSILDSISKVPLGLRYLCAKLNEITSQFFSESQYVAIGGLVFLRLICPTIVAPNVFGILDQKEKITPKIRKALVVISKIIQSISNGCLFKDAGELVLLNEFVEESIPRLKGFMDSLIKPVYCLEPKPNDELNENVVVVDQKENDLVVFKVSENLSKCFLVSSNRFDLERKIIENIPIEKCSLPSKNEIESALDNIYNLDNNSSK
ncbi:ras gtpase-activating protein [Anaeramoeba ignava]|uniref:Ras gtpase-activating protein n=1 Tax=Anaeramoeba ignava TaxID=1746090 RepID=A0A9Q0LUH9_ANAIG|nr:ras gtpase-activating protein [Anaeramoeba ignava]